MIYDQPMCGHCKEQNEPYNQFRIVNLCIAHNDIDFSEETLYSMKITINIVENKECEECTNTQKYVRRSKEST